MKLPNTTFLTRRFANGHKMVLRGTACEEALKQIHYYSINNRDCLELYIISQLLTNEYIFSSGTRQWTLRYAKMRKPWLNTKGPDVAIFLTTPS
ncbi:hypothetical protein BC628DRAFT_1114514 [Trametes gibbosa]|nr:hypothetical protein BC628DRAFT_1114514 [Trametes gibbosa]